MDGGAIGVLYFIAAVVFLIIQLFIADEFRNVAVEKGYDSWKYFWYVFLFWVIGMLLVIALPDKAGRYTDGINAAQKNAADELPEL